MPSPSSAFAPGVAPDGYRIHALHDPARDWPQTNCYADLWIEAVAARGAEPEAMLGFCAALDFEGDQFTFFKPSLDDVETLYGLGTFELAVYDELAGHIAEQCARGRLPMIEVDAFHLADTRGVSYQIEHSKTTIGVNTFDLAARRADVFHNEGYFRVEGDDFAAIFRLSPQTEYTPPPYAEYVKPLRPALAPAEARTSAEAMLARHVLRRPPANPVRAFAAALPLLIERARAKDPSFFHKLAFNTLRQLGANFELFASHLAWLDAGAYATAIAPARQISAGAKAMQFMLARALMRNKPFDGGGPLEELVTAYDAMFAALATAQRPLRRAS